jgi:hypothetical protein
VEILEQKSSAYKVLIGKPEGKRTLGRPRHKDNNRIKIYFKNIF